MMTSQLLQQLALPAAELFGLSIILGVSSLRAGIALHRRLNRRSARQRRVEVPSYLKSLGLTSAINLVCCTISLVVFFGLTELGVDTEHLTDQIMMGIVAFPPCFLAATGILMKFIPTSFQRAIGICACLLGVFVAALPLTWIVIRLTMWTLVKLFG